MLAGGLEQSSKKRGNPEFWWQQSKLISCRRIMDKQPELTFLSYRNDSKYRNTL
jgi:hypothetical protein